MKKALLDTLFVKDINQLHEEIAKVLKFPDYYGKNLDALYDCLTSDLELPLKLVWKNYPAALKNIGESAELILKTLGDFSKEEPEFELEVE